MSFLQSAPTGLHRGDDARPSTGKTDDLPLSRSGAGLLAPVGPLVRLIRNPADAVAGLLDRLRDPATSQERAEAAAVEQRRHILHTLKANAATFDEWRASAEELDVLAGHDAWKACDDSPYYDAALVAARLRELDDARIACDVRRMLFLVRTSLARGLGGMGNVKLYRHSHRGTKDLIERYIDSALDTLAALLAQSARSHVGGADSKRVLDQLLSARQSFGRSALLLSGGATFGMNHIGVLKTLWEARLLPRIISGASAGSIVAAVLCTQTDEQIPRLLERFAYGDLSVFEPSGDEDSILTRLARFLKVGAWIDIGHLMRVMRDLLGHVTFQEAYNRTRRILNICVSSASLYELPRLLNYVTAPNVLIWSAVAASCSVPFVFSAASLLAKDPNTGEAVPWNPSPQRWIDGSVDNDLPMTRLAEMFNVNHFIVSQVNPHVVPFLAKDEEAITAEAAEAATSSWPGLVHTAMGLAKAEALHRLHVLTELGLFPNTLSKARSVLSQKYSGDITIFPEISYADFPRMLKNPTTDFMLQATLCGARATWPKLSQIRNHCAIELALDDAVQQLRARVVFSPSQVNLRLNAFGGLTGLGLRRPGTGPDRGRGRGGRGARRGGGQGPEPASRTVHTALPSPELRQSRTHVTSRSTTALAFASADEKARRQDRSPQPPRLTIPTPHPADFTSSGGDTSHSPFGSSSLTSDSSSTSSPTSPSYFPGPSSTASYGLFPHASQPATPHASGQARWGFFTVGSPSESRSRSPAPTTAAQSDLMMTPTAEVKRSGRDGRSGSGSGSGGNERGMASRRTKGDGSVERLTTPTS
ncbi:MAG: hypothetical protein M1832_000856 [Thelocarpon impressellum]|nr:MAG: hypothetical protein M1832_000856 [Thelocarpon impressellum]